MKIKLPLLALTSFLALSCTSNSPDDLEGAIPANVSYDEHVRPIIEANCIGCHQEPLSSSGAPMTLTSYEEVKQAIISRPLIDRISRPQGAEGMMPRLGTRLPQTKIDIIIKWRDQDFQP